MVHHRLPVHEVVPLLPDVEPLSEDERQTLDGKLSPHGVIIPQVVE